MEKSKAFPPVTHLSNPHAITAVVLQTTTIKFRIVITKDNSKALSLILRFQAPPRSPPLSYHQSRMGSRTPSSRCHQHNDLLRKGIVDQACNHLLGLHRNNKMLWPRYKEVETWKDEPQGGTQRIRYPSILALPPTAYPCCRPPKILPYLIEVGMYGSQ